MRYSAVGLFFFKPADDGVVAAGINGVDDLAVVGRKLAGTQDMVNTEEETTLIERDANPAA